MNFTTVNFEEIDKETVLFKNIYLSNISDVPLLTYPNLKSVYKEIIVKYPISKFQQKVLFGIFNEFQKIQKEIDPYKIMDFKHILTLEGELVFYRNSVNGLTNLVIDDEDLVTFSFISKNSSVADKLEFYEEEPYNFEKIVYSLFSF